MVSFVPFILIIMNGKIRNMIGKHYDNNGDVILYKESNCKK